MGSKSKKKINVIKKIRVHSTSGMETGVVLKDCERVFETIEEDEEYYNTYVLPFVKEIEKRKALAKKNLNDETEQYKKHKANDNESTCLSNTTNTTLINSNSFVSTKDSNDFKIPLPIEPPKPKKGQNKKRAENVSLEQRKAESNKMKSRSVCYPEKPKAPELDFRSFQIGRRKLYDAEEWLNSVEFDNQFKQN